MRTVPRRIGAAWSRPRAAGADGPRPRDGALLTAVAAVSVFEGFVRPDLDWPLVTVVVTLAILPVLLWRRTRPLPAVAAMTAATSAFALAHRLAGFEPNALVTTFVFLTAPYALFRWGSGRDRIVGAGIVAAGLLTSSFLGSDPIADTAAGVAFMGGACLLGALRRERVESRARRIDSVRAREREALARDLHDTVAHHVSAIVIRAQVAGADPEDTARVAESLRVIETEAQAVLADMRSLVRTLRAPADYAPTAGLDELARLADPGPPRVAVRIDAPADLPSVVTTTLFRIAQEGVTNARRHSRGATGIDVEVTVDDDEARVRVRDDGAPARGDQGGGHGLQGMSERAALLGGAVAAGPDPAGGWTLRASLPLGGRA
ncbi:Signal transduction histidine kinase [Glycomyces sambucus]|uniref:histidine kinase n=1 Tax=Glycomyces sambucus TaxID=380244 RepID=A0A1G9KA57_9ACTN|nr:histidine kinase [Glycomyces sambucus]SDL46314.1 Signal transduction histidine kinase [Glycomyces sambucus]